VGGLARVSPIAPKILSRQVAGKGARAIQEASLAERDEADAILRVIPGSALALCVKLLVGAAGLYLILQFLGFQSLFRDDGEGVGALLQIIGTLYSVLYAFATYVIWGQFTAVENEILKESGALKDLLLFSRPLGENAREPIVRAVKSYARVVVESECERCRIGRAQTGAIERFMR
jgi:hypothetical protein